MKGQYPNHPPTYFSRQYHLRRLYCPARKAYLHLSGAGFVTGTAYAWSGTKREAFTLAERNPELDGCALLPLHITYAPQLDGWRISELPQKDTRHA